ncbi:MAG: hypothetical protein ACRESJ_27875 [Pseudomonas sp.]
MGYLRDSVELLDNQGKVQRAVPSVSLPRQAPVLSYDQELDLVQVEVSGQKVWLDSMTVRVEPPLHVVDLPCEKLIQNQAEDQQNNATIGFGAGCKK